MLNWRLENQVPPPMPGNPGLIQQFAQRYDRMADALNEAVGELRALANEGVSISLAIDEVRERAQESIDTTQRVAIRYAGASRTLNSYQDALGDAIATTAAARNTIAGNNPNAGYWRRQELALRAQLLIDPSNTTVADDLREATGWVRQYDAEYQQAITSYNNATYARDAAVNTAIAGLDDAAQLAGLNDNFWEGIEGAFDAFYDLAQKYLAPIITIIREVLEVIKSIVDILAFIVTILAIFIPVLAPIAAALTIVSLALSVLIFACSLVLFALGKETLGRVLGDLIGVAVSCLTAVVPVGLGNSVSAIAQNGVTMLSQTAAVHLSLAFRMGTQTAIRSAGVVLGEVGQEVAVSYGTEIVTSFMEQNANETFSTSGQPWTNPDSTPGGQSPSFDFDWGGELLNAATGGITGLPGQVVESFNTSVDAGMEYAQNVTQITAVPAG